MAASAVWADLVARAAQADAVVKAEDKVANAVSVANAVRADRAAVKNVAKAETIPCKYLQGMKNLFQREIAHAVSL